MAAAPSLLPAQGSAGHGQIRLAAAFCPSLTFPLPAGLGWDDQARRPLILLTRPWRTPALGIGLLQGTGLEAGEGTAVMFSTAAAKTKPSLHPALPYLLQVS